MGQKIYRATPIEVSVNTPVCAFMRRGGARPALTNRTDYIFNIFVKTLGKTFKTKAPARRAGARLKGHLSIYSIQSIII